MSRAARWSFVGLCIVLGLLGLSQPDRSPQLSPTTYGETPIGYGAVLAMLTQLGLPAGRTFAARFGWPNPARPGMPVCSPRCTGPAFRPR